MKKQINKRKILAFFLIVALLITTPGFAGVSGVLEANNGQTLICTMEEHVHDAATCGLVCGAATVELSAVELNATGNEGAAAESAPAEPAAVENTPAESAPAENAPVESTPSESAPAESTPTEGAPAESTPSENAPVEGAPTEGTPTESAPAEGTPTEGTPTEGTPAEGTPTESTPAEGTPTEGIPSESSPTEGTAHEHTDACYNCGMIAHQHDASCYAVLEEKEKPACPDCGLTEGHEEDCALYAAPVVADPDAAKIYMMGYDGEYQQIKNHGTNNRFNIRYYGDETFYVPVSTTSQAVYFEYSSWPKGDVQYSVNDTTYATVEVNDNGASVNNARVVLDAAIPAGTEVVVTATRLDGKGAYSVTIVMVETVPLKATFSGDIKAEATDSMKAEMLRMQFQPNGGAALMSFGFSDNAGQPVSYFYDIEPNSGAQNGESTTITVGGLLENDNPEYTPSYVTVTHLLDSAEAIQNAEAAGNRLSYFEVDADTAEAFPLEIAAAKEYSGTDGRVYYTVQTAEIDENGNIVFCTDSFSTFMFTVYFEYNGYKYSLDGMDSVSLDDLFKALGMEYTSADVADVQFSNPDLIDVRNENGVWILESLESFQTTEWLWITLTDGTTIKIQVTDPIKVSPELLRNILEENDRYEIREIPATLYNYDGKKFNNNRQFQFRGNSRETGSNTTQVITDAKAIYINNNNLKTIEPVNPNDSAKLGILDPVLVNGIPVFAMGDVGKNYLFSTDDTQGKTVYSDAAFEFVYDNETNYYTYYSGLNHAQYDADTNKIELYQYGLSPLKSETDPNNNYSQMLGGFYPFTDISSAKQNDVVNVFDLNIWSGQLANYNSALVKTYPAVFYKDECPTYDSNTTMDMHFGVALDTQFYYPKDGLTNNDERLLFQFTGDDDLWVYIDGKLVLDIGGAHDPIFGEIDLTNGSVHVSSAYDGQISNDTAYKKVPYEGKRDNNPDNDTDLEVLAKLKEDGKGEMHRLQVFYLERFSGSSNYYMRFNLPIISDGTIMVSKDVKDSTGNDLTVLPDETYSFKLEKSVDNGQSFTAVSNISYKEDVLSDEVAGETNSEGIFYLKKGQTAVFTGLPVLDKDTNNVPQYRVTEVESGAYTNRVECNGADLADGVTTVTGTFAEKDLMTFDFVNYIDAEPLVIEKQVIGGTAGLVDSNQVFNFELNLDPKGEDKKFFVNGANESQDKVTFSLKHGESYQLPSVPVGLEYTLAEINPDTTANSFDAPKYTHQVGTADATEQTVEFAATEPFASTVNYTVTAGGKNKTVVTNQQRGDIIIDKNIVNGFNDIDAKQTFLFNIKGLDDHNKDIDVDVVVLQDGSVTVKDVPVGRYEITEDTGWSWRYNIVSDVTQNVLPTQFAPGNNVNKVLEKVVEFINERVEKYWLDGNSDCENNYV